MERNVDMALYLESREITDYDVRIAAIPEHRWYPVYCRPNKEKKLLTFAAEQQIPGYMPEVLRHRMVRGRRIVTPVPMFAGYVFLSTTRQQNWTIRQSPHVIRILPIQEAEEAQFIAELNVIRIFEDLARSQAVDVRPELVPGKRVIISQGRLRGIEGIVEKRKNAVELIVRLDFMGCSIATVEAYDLEPI